MTVRAVVLAAAICAAQTPPVLARQITSPALVDRDLTIGAGATISTTLGDVITRAEEALIPHRLFDERGVARRGTNVTFRLFKLAFVDTPQERLLLVVNHELFGHGARLRERFDGPIAYEISAPPPYGPGSGSTSYLFDRTPARYERLAVGVGGMEASGVAAAIVTDRAFERQRMHPRDALRYLAFELDTLSYVLGTDEGGEEPGHDVADFLGTYNAVAAATGAPLLTPRALRREALASLANPMLAYAAYGIGRYLWNGATDVAVPALSIASVRYLPMLRYRLAPYGTEWSLVNELGGRIRPTQIELRVGRSPHVSPWGVRVRQRDLATWRQWSMEASVDVWRQPRFAGAADEPLTTDLRTGAQVRGRAERPLMPVWFSTHPSTVIVDLGVKTAGFVPGEPLRGGAVLRAGVGLPLAP